MIKQAVCKSKLHTDGIFFRLKDLPCTKASRQSCGTLTLEEEVVKAIENVVDKAFDPKAKKKCITMQVLI